MWSSVEYLPAQFQEEEVPHVSDLCLRHGWKSGVGSKRRRRSDHGAIANAVPGRCTSMLYELFLSPLISLLLAASSHAAHPSRATCPKGWFAAGVPPHGATVCRLDTGEAGPCVRLGTKCPEEYIPELPIRIWCEPKKMAYLVDNDRIIGCTRRASTARPS